MKPPNPEVTRKLISVANKLSYLTSFPEEGKGPWENSKDLLQNYDYIVLGGGSAGCVVASRLAEDPNVNVLVLEAGYSDDVTSSKTPALFMFNIDNDTDWQFKSTPQVHAGGRIMKQPRGKLLGGTSSINAMMYHRGPSSDFDEWEALGNPGWSYKDCLPYFKKSEGFNDPSLPPTHPKGPLTNRIRKPQYETFDPEYHGTDGPWQVSAHFLHGSSEGFIRANVAEGININKDFNGASTLGVNKIQTFIQRDGTRSSLSRAYLKPNGVVPGGKDRGTIRVVYGANIQRVLVQSKNGAKMAYGAEFLDHTNVLRRVVATREVLLCAGAFGSPHILLASGIGPSPQYSIPHVHTLPGVGANLLDHLGIGVNFRARNRSEVGAMGITKSLPSLINYKLHGTGFLSSQLGEVANFVRLEDFAPEFVAREKANGTYIERASGPNSPHIEIIFSPFYGRKHATMAPEDTKKYYTMIALLLNPASVGTVKIAPKKTKTADGRVEFDTVIDPNYLAESFDARVMAEAVKLIRRIGRKLNMDPEVGGREVFPGESAVPDDDDAKLEQYVRNNCETYYHPTSTCRMGPSTDPLAVVDSRLRVHGIDRLRVIDASSMPKLTAGHTCAPTVLIGERASDMIKEDWSPAVGKQNLARL